MKTSLLKLSFLLNLLLLANCSKVENDYIQEVNIEKDNKIEESSSSKFSTPQQTGSDDFHTIGKNPDYKYVFIEQTGGDLNDYNAIHNAIVNASSCILAPSFNTTNDPFLTIIKLFCDEEFDYDTQFNIVSSLFETEGYLYPNFIYHDTSFIGVEYDVSVTEAEKTNFRDDLYNGNQILSYVDENNATIYVQYDLGFIINQLDPGLQSDEIFVFRACCQEGELCQGVGLASEVAVVSFPPH